MGQWMKAIGGYTVEQTGLFTDANRTCFPFADILARLLSLWHDCFRHSLDPRMCYLDGLHALTRSLARPSLYVNFGDRLKHLHPSLEQPNRSEVLRVLCVCFASVSQNH